MVDMIDNDGRCSFCGSSMNLVDSETFRTSDNSGNTVTEKGD
jgi:hypothetical protein